MTRRFRSKHIALSFVAVLAATIVAVRCSRPSLSPEVAATVRTVEPIEHPFVEPGQETHGGRILQRRGAADGRSVLITFLKLDQIDGAGGIEPLVGEPADRAVASFIPLARCYSVDALTGESRVVDKEIWLEGSSHRLDLGILELTTMAGFTVTGTRSSNLTLHFNGKPVAIAGNTYVLAGLTFDRQTAAVASVLGHRKHHAGFPGMGGSTRDYGELYIQALDIRTGRVIGPAFHLLNAVEQRKGDVAPESPLWLIDRKLLLITNRSYRKMWIIAHDWEADAKALPPSEPPAPSDPIKGP